jgi:endonuclease YncB( thermonuclease family)
MLYLATMLSVRLRYAYAGMSAAFAVMAAHAADFGGMVTHVTDGDTVWIRPDAPGAKAIKLRLEGIDAPERCQAWGGAASAALASRVLGQHVQVRTRATDTYDRQLGNITLAGEDISAWMVANGHAWSYRYRHNRGPYVVQENQARAGHRGLFADPLAIEPRRFRQRHGACS